MGSTTANQARKYRAEVMRLRAFLRKREALMDAASVANAKLRRLCAGRDVVEAKSVMDCADLLARALDPDCPEVY